MDPKVSQEAEHLGVGGAVAVDWSPSAPFPLPQIRGARPAGLLRRTNSDSYVIDCFDQEDPHVPSEARFCQHCTSERSYPSAPPRSSWWQERRERKVRTLQQEALAQTWRTLFSGSLPTAFISGGWSGPCTSCRICLSDVPVTESVVLMQCGRTQHGTCRDCMRAYLRLRIEEGRVSDLWCPCKGNDDCEAAVTQEELEAWLDTATLAKYARFEKMAANPQLRSCPSCKNLCSPTMREDGKLKSHMTCQDCGAEFCYFHSNAHEPGDEACAAYERSVVKQAMLNGAMSDTKPCPACGFRTEKVSGCNHMTCKCKVDWCWACEKEITSSVGWHYNPMNPKGCMQFQETGNQRNCIMLICKILSLPAYLVSLLFLFVHMLILLFTCCFPLCFCGEDKALTVWLGFSCAIMAIPFGAWVLSWGLVAVVIFLLLFPFGARLVHLEYMATVPMATMASLMENLTRDADSGNNTVIIEEPVGAQLFGLPKTSLDTNQDLTDPKIEAGELPSSSNYPGLMAANNDTNNDNNDTNNDNNNNNIINNKHDLDGDMSVASTASVEDCKASTSDGGGGHNLPKQSCIASPGESIIPMSEGEV